MKHFLFFTILIISIHIFAQPTDAITNVRHNRGLLPTGRYEGSLSYYENRLFVSTMSSIEEYKINEDGTYERVYVYSTGNIIHPSLVHESCLYVIYTIDFKHYMLIFDLTSQPMTFIEKHETPTSHNAYLPNLQKMHNYIFIMDDDLRIQRFNTITRQWDASLPYAFGMYTTMDSYIVSLFHQSSNTLIRVFDYNTASANEPYGEIIGDFFLDNIYFDSPRNMKIEEKILYINGNYFEFGVFDISDFGNISTIAYKPAIETTEMAIDASLYDEETLFVYTYDPDLKNNGIYCFNLPNLVSAENIFNGAQLTFFNNPMLIQNKKIYASGYDGVYVYDIIDNCSFITRLGIDDSIVHSKDEFSLYDFREQNLLRIYSLLDSDLIVDIETNMPNGTNYVRDFKIVDQQLYLLVTNQSLDDAHLEIYNIEQKQLTNRFYLNDKKQAFWLIDNYIVIYPYDGILYNEQNDVYLLEDNTLNHIGSFIGIPKGHNTGYQHPRYFMVETRYNLVFRDINDPLTVLFTIAKPNADFMLPDFTTDGLVYFLDTNYYPRIYALDENLQRLTYLYRIPRPENKPLFPFPFQGILTSTLSIVSDVYFYDATATNELKLGTANSHLLKTNAFTFLDHETTAFRTGTGMDIFDFNYVKSENNKTVLPEKTGLLANYPNPFNPETTIRFVTIKPGEVVLNIFNIRGQKVRSLFKEYIDAGTHSVVWDGQDENGKETKSGVYFYQMITDDLKETKKMVLLK